MKAKKILERVRIQSAVLVAIPVAGGLFVHWGFDLPMSMVAGVKSLSTIIVAANAQLLRRLKLQRATH